jgi:uncharacterized repeat protein (TIGR03837 family)
VRLWIDDASALRWMAPDGVDGVELCAWPADDVEAIESIEPGDVVIEAFGCELPPAALHRMAATARPPVWINLEYLSAEDYVERVHRLPSPQTVGPAAGLRKTFFYPGFTARTGGLLREPGLLDRQARFDREAWLQVRGIKPEPGERLVSLFCYGQPALPSLLDRLAQRPTLLLATVGQASRQVGELLGASLRRGHLRAHLLPAIPQTAYDELLWASDLNLVRGEDSFVRAQWAGKPFVWQAYPQYDAAHLDKVQAFVARFVADTPPAFAASVHRFWSAWNDAALPLPSLPSTPDWQAHCSAWRARLAMQDDLVTQLIGFVAESR